LSGPFGFGAHLLELVIDELFICFRFTSHVCSIIAM
jgi:hypothetical protein